jgi:hypothetical protein
LVAPTTPSLKLAITPALVLLGTAPTVVAESPSTFPKVAVCHSAPARLALLCTRLI